MASLEFCLPPEDAARLLRSGPLAKLPRSRPVTADQIWHDTAAGALEAGGVSLSEQRDGWRLQRMHPDAGLWPPGTPPALLAEGHALDDLGRALPGPLMPVAAFKGRRRVIPIGPEASASLTLIEGMLRGITQERPICRILLDGPAEQVEALSSQLAATTRLSVPRGTLAGEAIALAHGHALPPRRDGAPEVPPGATLADAIAIVFSHLADVILAGSATTTTGVSSEPVHRMRVAVRRMRSALSVFHRATDGPVPQSVKQALRELATRLGVARDWDVFLEGTGHAIAAAFPEDHRVAALLVAARRQKSAAYHELARYVGGAEFRQLELGLVQLAALRPWQAAADAEQAEMLAADAEAYATLLLHRRLNRMLAPGADIEGLPVDDLHAIRKEGKRLRYAGEFFALLFPRKLTRRFIDHLAELQEELGHLNDGAAAGVLMARLPGGADRAYATGVVAGFVAASNQNTRRRIARAWGKFRKQEPFWS